MLFALTGTDNGALYGLQSPSLNRYCCARSHAGRVCGLALYGDGAASVSSNTVCYHPVGGMCHLRHTNNEVCPVRTSILLLRISQHHAGSLHILMQYVSAFLCYPHLKRSHFVRLLRMQWP